jgi:hypothetical protein
MILPLLVWARGIDQIAQITEIQPKNFGFLGIS